MAVRKPRSTSRGRRKTATKPAKRRSSAAAKIRSARTRPSRPAPPGLLGPIVQQMDYTSHALDEVKRFYTEVLGFGRFAHDERRQRLAIRTGESSSLGFMPALPGPPEQWRPPREPAITLRVRDVDRVHRQLVAKGVTFEQEPTDLPSGDRVARLRDPEGRMLCIASTPRKAARKGHVS